MKSLLFLDCDGVMATHKTFGAILADKNADFDPVAVKCLNAITAQVPNLEIVISSTWRLGETVESFQRILAVRGVNGKVVGLTPRLRLSTDFSAPRGCEIAD